MENKFFDDPTVKEFMIQVVKRMIGIIDSWINNHYHLDKCIVCPNCHNKVILDKNTRIDKVR